MAHHSKEGCIEVAYERALAPKNLVRIRGRGFTLPMPGGASDPTNRCDVTG